MLDLYRPILAHGLFPAFEAIRGRPTVPLIKYVEETQYWSLDHLEALQVGFLRRLVMHAKRHVPYYRDVMQERALEFTDFNEVGDLAKLPLLDRPTATATFERRMTEAPPFHVIEKRTSGSSGEPVVVRYNAESRHWRDAIRWRGYGWAGYRVGMKALHYWGVAPTAGKTLFARAKAEIDHRLKRDRYVDCTPRGRDDLYDVVKEIRSFEPDVIVAYANGAATLARFINDRGLDAWHKIPVITGAEALSLEDRQAISYAFGQLPFDTYGCREVMLMGSECEAHDGLHQSMENLIVEIVVRSPDGSVRAAEPGEVGEVAVTDLHNLSCPMIRYLTGDLATAHAREACSCGRSLAKIGAVQGRVCETLVDGEGNAVNGLVFNIMIATHGDGVKNFQIVQRADKSVTFKVVPVIGDELPEALQRLLVAQVARYLPGIRFQIETVKEIPLSPAGKRRVVVVEQTA